MNAEEDYKEDVALMSEWWESYGDLKNQVKMEEHDSGSFWAGLFIARLIKSMQ